MASKLATDSRIDPRIKAILGAVDAPAGLGDVPSREALLKEVNSPEAIAAEKKMLAMLDMIDNESVAVNKHRTGTPYRRPRRTPLLGLGRLSR